MAQTRIASISRPPLRWASGLLLLVYVVGCGGRTGAEQAAPSQSVDLGNRMHQAGTRLVPLAWVSDSGPTIYTQRFYDRQRDENCSFARADDGTLRCFPLGLTVDVADDAVSRRYADSSCSQTALPLNELRLEEILEFPAFPDLRYFALENEGGCNNARRIYDVLPANADAPYVHSTLGCHRSSSASTYLASGERVANEQFAAGSYSVATRRDTRLGLQQITSTDGAAAILGAYDLVDENACLPTRVNQTEVRCVGMSLSENYAIGSEYLPMVYCSGLVAVASPCEQPRYVFLNDFGNVTVHQVVPLSEVNQPSSALSECASASSSDPARVYAILDAVPTALFPLLESRTVVKGRIQRSQGEWVGTEGSVVVPIFENFTGELMDLKLQLRCALMPATDGKMRCLPNGGWQEYYADADCSERLLSGDSDGSAFSYYTLGEPGELHPVVIPGEVHVGEIYEHIVGMIDGVMGGCQSVAGQMKLRTWYRTAAEVPPERFVQYALTQMQ